MPSSLLSCWPELGLIPCPTDSLSRLCWPLVSFGLIGLWNIQGKGPRSEPSLEWYFFLVMNALVWI